MIRHWHPIKLGIVWFIDLAILLILWLLVSPYRRDDQALVIFVWLVLSIPALVVTWKWASDREMVPKKIEPLPPLNFEKVTADQARTLALRSMKEHLFLRVRQRDGSEMDIAVAEDLGTFCRAFRNPIGNPYELSGFGWVDYRKIEEAVLTEKSFAFEATSDRG